MKHAKILCLLSVVVAVSACAPGRRSGTTSTAAPREYKDALDSERAEKFIEMYRRTIEAEARANQLEAKLGTAEANAGRLQAELDELKKVQYPGRYAYPDEADIEVREPVVETNPVDADTQQAMLTATLRDELQSERKKREMLEDELDAMRTAADPKALAAVKDGSALRAARAENRDLKEQLAAAKRDAAEASKETPSAVPARAKTAKTPSETEEIETAEIGGADAARLKAELARERERTALLEEKLKVAEKVTDLLFRRDQARK